MKEIEKCSACGAILKTNDQNKKHQQFLKQQNIKEIEKRSLDEIKANKFKKLKKTLDNEKFNSQRSQNDVTAIIALTDWRIKEINRLTAELKKSKKVIKTLTKELKEQREKQGEKNIIIEPLDWGFSNLKTSKFNLAIDATKKYGYQPSYKDLTEDKNKVENIIKDIRAEIVIKNTLLQEKMEELEEIKFLLLQEELNEKKIDDEDENKKKTNEAITDKRYSTPKFNKENQHDRDFSFKENLSIQQNNTDDTIFNLTTDKQQRENKK